MNRTPCLLIAAVIAAGLGCSSSDDTKPPASGTVETTLDSAPSTSTDTDKEGSERPTVELPADVPSDIPIMSDTRLVHVGSSTSTSADQGTQHALTFETTKSVEEVTTFYATELAKQDWSIKLSTAAIVAVEKPDKRFVQVTAGESKTGQVGFSIHYR